MKMVAQVGFLLLLVGSTAVGQVDYAFIPDTGSVDIPHGPGLRANSQFSATITVANQSPNQGNVLQSVIRYELVPNFGGPFLPTTKLRWRAFPNSPLLNTDPPIRDLATPNTNFVFTTLLSVPPGITPGNYSLRAILDPNHIQNDSNRANNTNIIHSSLTVLATPDLTWPGALVVSNQVVARNLEILNPNPNDLYSIGETFTVRTLYRNVGDPGFVQPFPIDYYLLPPRRTHEHYNPSGFLVYRHFRHVWWGFDNPVYLRFFLGRRTAPGLNPGETNAIFDTTFTLPNFPAGMGPAPDWVLGAILNPDATWDNPTNQLMEASYENNRPDVWQFYPPVRFAHLAGLGPDLRFRENSVQVSSTSVAVGGSIMVTGTVQNIGNQAVPQPTVFEHRLVRVDDTTGSSLPSVYLIRSTTVPTLPAAVPPGIPVHHFAVQLTIPPTVPGGTYRYMGVLDAEHEVHELNTQNNLLVLQSPLIEVDGQSGMVDLRTGWWPFWTNSVSSSTVSNKHTFAATIDVVKSGTGEAGPFSIRFSLQQLSGFSPNVIVGPPVAIGTLAVPAGLEGRTNLVATLEMPDSETIAPGFYRLFWELDFLNQVLETNEDNNWGYWGQLGLGEHLTVVDPEAGLLPDLAPFEFSFGPSEIGVGKNPAHVTFTNWIENIGTQASPAFSYQIYLTPDPDPSTTNLIFKASRPMPPIHAGDRAQDIITIALPETFPVGIYYPVMIIDGNNNVVELDKSNNKIFYGDKQLLVTAQEPSERPILEVINFDHSPTERIPGQPFHYHFTLVNNGVLPMVGLMVDVALNYDGQFSIGENDRILVEHGPFSIPGEGGSIDVSGSLVFDEPTLPDDAYRVIWGFNRREPGVDTQNGPIHLTRDVTVRTLNPRIGMFVAGHTGGGPIVYLTFDDSHPGRTYQIQRSTNLQGANGGFHSPMWHLPPGDPSTTLLTPAFNLLLQPAGAAFYRVIDVTE